MNRTVRSILLLIASVMALLVVSCASGPGGSHGFVSMADAHEIEEKSRAALDQLYRENPKALRLAQRAEGVLIFPEIIKGGVVFGGAVGDGALYQRNQPTGYYRTLTASWGLAFGLQKHGYALFLMDQSALDNLNRTGGWEIGTSPNLVVIDHGVAGTFSSVTIDQGTYAVFFNQTGLMAGVSLEGTKITRLNIQAFPVKEPGADVYDPLGGFGR